MWKANEKNFLRKSENPKRIIYEPFSCFISATIMFIFSFEPLNSTTKCIFFQGRITTASAGTIAEWSRASIFWYLMVVGVPSLNSGKGWRIKCYLGANILA